MAERTPSWRDRLPKPKVKDLIGWTIVVGGVVGLTAGSCLAINSTPTPVQNDFESIPKGFLVSCYDNLLEVRMTRAKLPYYADGLTVRVDIDQNSPGLPYSAISEFEERHLIGTDSNEVFSDAEVREGYTRVLNVQVLHKAKQLSQDVVRIKVSRECDTGNFAPPPPIPSDSF